MRCTARRWSTGHWSHWCRKFTVGSSSTLRSLAPTRHQALKVNMAWYTSPCPNLLGAQVRGSTAVSCRKSEETWKHEARCMSVHWSRTCDRRPLLVLSFRGGPLTLAAQSARGLPMVLRGFVSTLTVVLQGIDRCFTGQVVLWKKLACLVIPGFCCMRESFLETSAPIWAGFVFICVFYSSENCESV